MAGIYFHIPFCRKACHYCNFHFSTSLKYKNEMIQALLRELDIRKDFLKGEAIDTIYFGGGTPSLLDEDDVARLMDKVQTVYKPSHLKEVTLEANPDDIHTSNIKSWLKAGIDRLSIGVQSFYEEDLQYMNRTHNALQAERAIKASQDGGIENLSIDLIFGFPLLTHEKWTSNLRRVIEYQVPHVSTYAMTVEDKTALADFIKKGKYPDLDSEQSASQYEFLMDFLVESGFEHYEISSFALPGRRAVHNSNYWNATPYIGIGPSAHSYDGNCRQWNTAVNAKYIKSMEIGSLDAENEELTDVQKVNERIMIGLRTAEGINLNDLRAQMMEYQYVKMMEKFPEFLTKGSIFIEDDVARLTRKGKLYADGIASMLFIS
jgi:oxygen-independent coproporphyrinogen-3 oxidase